MANTRRTGRNKPSPRTPSAGVSAAVRVRMLGGFSVSVGARTIEEGQWRLKKAASLLKILALAADQRMHRERVMDLLWPGLELS
jgi:DNA-binding SARP family transcriptional activator